MMGVLSTIGLILLAIVLLLIMITIHEFGHYTAGKMLGFKIYEFSIGFGKAIFKKKKKNGEVFAIRMIPLGGYCSFGEDDAGGAGTAGKLDLEKDDPGYYFNKAPWKRLVVLFMGAFFNFISAIIFAVILLCIIGYSRVAEIRYTDADTAADLTSILDPDADPIQAGSLMSAPRIIETDTVDADGKHTYTFKPIGTKGTDGDDIFLTVLEPSMQEDGRYVSRERQVIYQDTDQAMRDTINKAVAASTRYASQINGKKMNFLPTTGAETILKNFRAGETITLTFLEGGELKLENAAAAQKDYVTENSGYSYEDGVYHNFWGSLAKAIPASFEMAWLILTLLFQLVTGQLGMDGVGGTVATVAVMGESLSMAASFGFIPILSQLLFLITLISINLAVFNWLPIPSLDGARMVFTVIEWIRGKPVNRDLEAKIHFIGLMCLLAFVIFADVYWTISRFRG